MMKNTELLLLRTIVAIALISGIIMTVLPYAISYEITNEEKITSVENTDKPWRDYCG